MTKSDILATLINYYCNGNKSQFAKKIGISAQGLSSWISRNTFDIDVIYSKCEGVSGDWLITGKGDMLQPDARPINDDDTASSTINSHTRSEYKKSSKLKPRIPFTAAAGVLNEVAESANIYDCIFLPAIESLPEYDFTMIIQGDSMTPEFQSGDEVACRLIHESAYIQWGRTYILDTIDGAVLKHIYDNGDMITCKSTNPRYPDFNIPKERILQMALVVGFVRNLG